MNKNIKNNLVLIRKALQRAIRFTEENIDRVDADYISTTRKWTIIQDETELLRNFYQLEANITVLLSGKIIKEQ